MVFDGQNTINLLAKAKTMFLPRHVVIEVEMNKKVVLCTEMSPLAVTSAEIGGKC